jgi:hypothetical protein
MAKRKPSRPTKQGQSQHERAAAKRVSAVAGRKKKSSLRALPRKTPALQKRAAGSPRKPAPPGKTATKKAATRKAANAPSLTRAPARTPVAPRAKSPRLDRERRTLDEGTLRTPPSSLDMERHGTAARTGRADIERHRIEHRGMSSSITGGDVDVNVEDAYFTGDEAPGGDNPSPDVDVVDEIGKALGVQYDDSEELRGSDKVTERDKHRWEMDPASAEDYKDRK